MFKKLLIANRGAISRRVCRTLREMDVASVAVYSEADADSIYVREADESILLGPAPAAESYLCADKILAAAKALGAGAIHPGYGFLSENAAFAEACESEGIVFVGPTSAQMRAFGLKHTAREIAGNCGVPLLPGTGLLTSAEEAATAAAKIGYPVILKSTAGGGGIGMKVCPDRETLLEAFSSVQRLGVNNFKDAGIFLEKFVTNARHIEVQIFGDGNGRVLALGERDCSTQRRNQKMIEETPAPRIDGEQREKLFRSAILLGEAVNYRSAGTVEFVFDADDGRFYFLEVNTRLQVEHGVTEEVCQIDLVKWMIRLAQGETDFFDAYESRPEGHAIQVRIYAEDPAKNFQPSCGLLTEVRFGNAARCETWVETGTEVTAYYDPMLAKIIVHARDRVTAISKMLACLEGCRFAGIETNLEYLKMVISEPEFLEGRMVTRSLGDFSYAPRTVDVLIAGAMTTVQDWPGRVGFWNIGVPPSGPMDPLAHRLANRLVGNNSDAATLEIVMTGPILRFNQATTIAICGADFQTELNGIPLPSWQATRVSSGSELKMKSIFGHGARAYLAVAGGFDLPLYLGSRSTFTLGKFGGHGGRVLRSDDVLHFFNAVEPTLNPPIAKPPSYTNVWEIAVLYGPHGAPDFFTEADMAMFFSSSWKVHYNSNPTGVRLIGPKPQFARADGGEAGLHPSNIHDNAYAIGTVDFTGDMPIILGPDGPSLGGFVCPATIVSAELWKIGQLKAGDTIRFVPINQEISEEMERTQEAGIERLQFINIFPIRPQIIASPVVYHRAAEKDSFEVRYRRSGDKYLLVEYGPLVLDLALRFRVHALMQWLEKRHVAGITDLTPGIRSLQIHYDSRRLPLEELTSVLQNAEMHLPSTDEIEVPSRIVHLPLSWDDPATQLAIEKYSQSVRADAPWCPSNIEFIRRINGLYSIDEVREIVFQASYLVLGLGDVYLGAPVATPLDPRHRLVTTKYNPARTWTPENAVGIGGAYLCIYGMEGPGGYQFVGRTVQMWNAWHSTKNFPVGQPWLLRFFDQIRFFPVTAEQLLLDRANFRSGRYEVKIEETSFRMADYRAFLERDADTIADFRKKQRLAFAEERERWEAAGQDIVASELEPEILPAEFVLPPNGRALTAHLPGSVWQVLVEEGQTVAEGDQLIIIESMKMETALRAPCAGKVDRILVEKGRTIDPGQNLLILITDEPSSPS